MDIKGNRVEQVLVTQAADIAREIYLGLVLDRATRRVTLMASSEGGVDIEEVAATTPEKIIRVGADPLLGAARLPDAPGGLCARPARRAATGRSEPSPGASIRRLWTTTARSPRSIR